MSNKSNAGENSKKISSYKYRSSEREIIKNIVSKCSEGNEETPIIYTSVMNKKNNGKKKERT